MSIGSMNGIRRIFVFRASISAMSSARRASLLQSRSSASRAASTSARAPPLATARVRPRKLIALDELLVSWQHHVARAALAAKARLVHAIDGDADLAAFQDILDVPVLRRFLHRPLNQRLRATQKALA